MASRLRIAVLECDTPVGETKRLYGGFGNLFRELLEQGALRLALQEGREVPSLDISHYDVVNEQVYPEYHSVDAVLLSGSSYDAFTVHAEAWMLKLIEFVRKTLHEQMRVRVIGVCFGHQIIARALGVMPERSGQGWEVAVTPIELTEEGKQIFGSDCLSLHQMHRDVVPRCPPNTKRLGRSQRCEVQGMYVKNRLISVQGHPEFNGKIVNELLDLRRGIKFDEDIYLDGKMRAERTHDGVAVAAVFLKFALED